jgi:hypothetical protein
MLLAQLVMRGLQVSGAGAFTPEIARTLRGSAEFPQAQVMSADGETLARLLATDALRAAFGRIACAYDGGHIME